LIRHYLFFQLKLAQAIEDDLVPAAELKEVGEQFIHLRKFIKKTKFMITSKDI